MKELACLLGRQIDELHVVRYAGVVHEHRQRFTCTHVGNRFDTGIGAEVRNQWPNLDVRQRSDEFFEPIAATAHNHQIVTIDTEP